MLIRKRTWLAAAAAGSAVVIGAGIVTASSAPVVTVCPTMETVPVHNPLSASWDGLPDADKRADPDFDAVDDAAVWIHPSDPAKSLIINADKSDNGGYNLYNLDGTEHNWVQATAGDPTNRLNNVDIRYNFPLGAQRVALVGFSVRDKNNPRLAFYRVDPSTRKLVYINSPKTSTAQGVMPRGFAMYHSPNTGKYYAFVTDSGKTDQYEIDGSSGTVKLTLVRELTKTVMSSEGLVADDELGFLYLAEETNSGQSDPGHIWKYAADPAGSVNPIKAIATTTDGGGVVTPDIKGLTLYYAANGKGYVISASQGKEPGKSYSSFGVFDRQTGAYKGSFALTGSSCSIDPVAGEDGIDVTNFNLGSRFPKGLFITGDFENKDGTTLMRQNNKVVRWETVALALGLIVDNTWDPRAIGAPGGSGGGTGGGTSGGGTSGGGTSGGGGTTVGMKIMSVGRGGGTPNVIATPRSGSYRDPAYSIGRGRIAFAGPSGIVIARPDGSSQRLLAGTRGARHPAWGPRNRFVFYVKGGALYRRAVSGGATRRLVSSRVLWVAASPNGSQIAFQRREANRRSDIWTMTAAGTRPRNLTRTTRRSESQPTWANGRTVAFATVIAGRWTVLRKSVAGGPVRVVTPRSLNCQQPAYAPGGTLLTCIRIASGGNLLISLRANGSGARRVAVPSARPTDPTWAGTAAITFAAK